MCQEQLTEIELRERDLKKWNWLTYFYTIILFPSAGNDPLHIARAIHKNMMDET